MFFQLTLRGIWRQQSRPISYFPGYVSLQGKMMEKIRQIWIFPLSIVQNTFFPFTPTYNR